MKRGGAAHKTKQRFWTAAEDEILRARWVSAYAHQIAEQLGRSPHSVASRAKKLRLTKGRRPWTLIEERILRNEFPHFRSRDVALLLARSECSVNGWAHKLGIRKTPEYMASPDACRLRRGRYPDDEVGTPGL